MDGFAKSNKKCVVVIPAPMQKGRNFMGIKASVIMIDENMDKPMQIKPKIEERKTNIRYTI
jgi:hypothetical protein